MTLSPVRCIRYGSERSLVLDDEGNELVLPKMEQIPTDYFKKGDTVRAVVSKVDMKNASPVIILVTYFASVPWNGCLRWKYLKYLMV